MSEQSGLSSETIAFIAEQEQDARRAFRLLRETPP